MPTIHSTTYKTVVNTRYIYEGDSLEQAIRAWDAVTHTDTELSAGGIMVQSFTSDGTMIRDGWHLHVEGARVYLNPNIGREAQPATERER